MKKILKKIHLYLALVLCLPLILQGLSGSIMVFRNQISAAILNYKYDFAKGEVASKELIVQAAQQQAGEDLVVSSVKISQEKNTAAKVRFAKNGEKKPVLEIVIDPVSLQVLEVNDPSKNFFRLLKKFHEDLFIEGKVGRNIVGIYGFTMLFMCLSGLVLWWPKAGMLKRALTFKFSDTGKKLHRDLHGSFGFWFLLPLLVSSITGIYLIYFHNKESNKLWQTIHDGSAFGLVWQIVIFTIGLLPILFSVTGISLWLLKKRQKSSVRMS